MVRRYRVKKRSYDIKLVPLICRFDACLNILVGLADFTNREMKYNLKAIL